MKKYVLICALFLGLGIAALEAGNVGVGVNAGGPGAAVWVGPGYYDGYYYNYPGDYYAYYYGDRYTWVGPGYYYGYYFNNPGAYYNYRRTYYGHYHNYHGGGYRGGRGRHR